MLKFFPPIILGLISSLLLGLNVLFWVTFLFFFSFLKFLIPLPSLRRIFNRILPWIAENWISCNSGWMGLTQKTKWDVQGLNDLNYDNWYLVICNHQSWSDIFVMQHLLNRRIRLLKFFLKRELIWVPVMGLAWWALDFPFLRRHKADYLKKHPEQKGRDLETTRKACERFARYSDQRDEFSGRDPILPGKASTTAITLSISVASEIRRYSTGIGCAGGKILFPA